MIYGPNSKGNYQMLSKLAKKLPVFPKVNNQRSMLYIENLCEFIRLIIKNNDQGIYFPQNKQYASTTEIVKMINPKIKVIGILNLGVLIGSKIPGKVSSLCNKAFGNLVYEQTMSQYSENYYYYSLQESIEKTEVNK